MYFTLFIFVQMDEEAIWEAPDKLLRDLGLTAEGDAIKLKIRCRPQCTSESRRNDPIFDPATILDPATNSPKNAAAKRERCQIM